MSQSASYSPIPRAARAHWTIYLPSIVVALVWAGIYAWAVSHQPVLGGVRALALAVEALGLPLLLFFAAVRARVLVAEVRQDTRLYLRSGFLRPREVSIGIDEISSVRVRRSWAQRLFGGGALDVKTLSGERLYVTDLDHPDLIAAALVAPVRDDFGRATTTLH